MGRSDWLGTRTVWWEKQERGYSMLSLTWPVRFWLVRTERRSPKLSNQKKPRNLEQWTPPTEHGQFQASKLKPQRLQEEAGIEIPVRASLILLCVQLTCEWGEGKGQGRERVPLWEWNLQGPQGSPREDSSKKTEQFLMYENLLPPEQGQMDNHQWSRALPTWKFGNAGASQWTAAMETTLWASSNGWGRILGKAPMFW